MFSVAIGETGVIEEELRATAFFGELVFCYGEDAGIPAGGAPDLDDALAGNEPDLAAADSAAEYQEYAAGLGADFGGRCVARG
jgi:hypothetical protein